MVDRAAVRGLATLHELGIRTVVDLTVPGLGRDVRHGRGRGRPGRRSSSSPRPAGTRRAALPLYFQLHGPGRPIDGPDELPSCSCATSRTASRGPTIRAGMIKVVTDAAGITDDVARIMDAAADGAPRDRRDDHDALAPGHAGTASPSSAFLRARGVPLERVVIGHSGDTEDLDYLRALMDDGLDHRDGPVRHGARAARTSVGSGRCSRSLRLGYADRMVLSHDAAVLQPRDAPVVAGRGWRRGGTWRRSLAGSSRCCGRAARRTRTCTRCWSRTPDASSPRPAGGERRRPARASWTVITRGAGHEGGTAGPTGRDGDRRCARARAGTRRRADRGRRRRPVRLGPRASSAGHGRRRSTRGSRVTRHSARWRRSGSACRAARSARSS